MTNLMDYILVPTESTSEIAPAVSLPADCTELLERYARRQMEGKDLTDDSESSTSLVTEYLEESEAATGSDDSLEFLSEPIMIDPSSGAMLIVVQEAKTDEPEPPVFCKGFHMPSPGSDTSSLEIEYQTEESDIRAGSENIVKIEYSSESNENTSDLISEDLPEDSYTRPGSESKVMIKHPSEESSYSSTTSVNMSESEYLSGSSYNTSVSLSKYLPIRYSDVISEHLPEHSDTRPDNANIMIKHSSEESSYASTTSVNMSESEYLSGSSYNTSVSLSEYLPKRSESVDVAVEEKVSSEQKTPPVFRAPVDSMEGFVVSSRREPGIPEKIPVPLGSINVPRAPQNSFVRAERGGTRGPCAPVDSMEGFIVNSRGEPGIPEKIPVPLGSINVRSKL
ncbi:hypothetical protein XELAEV_18040779mg [Xenopus laevis]|uniref:Uncharacterized protein n=1 Tax=Xenopus laevis TaxID=8355 RepID=A0A974H967_XENLA|nr:hypothetical protein XELAEV_18040779mg [Xenopus laevis]